MLKRERARLPAQEVDDVDVNIVAALEKRTGRVITPDTTRVEVDHKGDVWAVIGDSAGGHFAMLKAELEALRPLLADLDADTFAWSQSPLVTVLKIEYELPKLSEAEEVCDAESR